MMIYLNTDYMPFWRIARRIMIEITFIEDSSGAVYGFHSKGHAGYAEYGSDIVCAAVSVLIINTVNSIEEFTDEKFKSRVSEGEVYFKLIGSKHNEDAVLLLKSLILGINGIRHEYGNKYIVVRTKRGQGE